MAIIEKIILISLKNACNNMIIYSNITRSNSFNFKEYLDTPGYSYSFLKGEQWGIQKEVPLTDKIRLGSLVDSILTEPEKVDMLSPLYPIARNIAAEIRLRFPYVIHFSKQVSFSGIATYENFTMPVRGRLDYLFEKNAVIDLKVTQVKNIPALIAFMGYENQMWNYCKLAQVDKAYLIIYSVPLKKAIVHYVDCSRNMNDFWAQKVLKFGNVK